MFVDPEKKKAYFKKRYEENKEMYKKNNINKWRAKAIQKFGCIEPSPEQLRIVRNEYYREYRKKNKDKIQEINARFYNKQSGGE